MCRISAAFPGGYLGSGHGGMLLRMTTVTAETGLHPCECGCGEMVKGKFKRGHYLRDQKNKLTRLPGPDDDLDSAENGEVATDSDAGLSQADRDALADAMRDHAEESEIPADKPAGRLKERGGKAPKARVRVTATVRRDVHAKIRFVLVPAGGLWQARDPLCGATFAAQEPEVSDALADIVCDSPDLLAFFTGPAGGFMKYFRLMMALQPVGLAVWAHHIAHVAELVDGQQPQQMPAYAA